MPSTTPLGLPIPLDADALANGALAMRNLANALDRRIVVALADQQNATATVAADTVLTVPVVAGRSYIYTAHMLFIAATSAVDVKLGPVFPAGSTNTRWSGVGMDVAVGAGNVGPGTFWGVDTATVIPFGIASSATPVLLQGYFTAGASGNFLIQWAQNTLTPASPLSRRIGSWLRVEAV